jgi:hypothetical protein
MNQCDIYIEPTISDVCSKSHIFSLNASKTTAASKIESAIFIDTTIIDDSSPIPNIKENIFPINNNFKIVKLDNNNNKSHIKNDDLFTSRVIKNITSETVYLSSNSLNSINKIYNIHIMEQPINIQNKQIHNLIDKINTKINKGINTASVNFTENKILNYLEQNDMNITIQNIMNITRIIMEIIELTNVKGTLQKQILMSILKKMIDKQSFDNEEIRNKLLEILNSDLIDNTVEIIINVSKGKYILNNLTNTDSNCCVIQ